MCWNTSFVRASGLTAGWLALATCTAWLGCGGSSHHGAADAAADGSSGLDAGSDEDGSPDGLVEDGADSGGDAQADAGGALNVRQALGTCEGTGRAPGPYPNQLSRGTDLHKVTLSSPDALCNDGTPAVLYVRAATAPAAANRWVLHLQGGGACTSYDDCRERWCGDGYYDASKMSSSFTPETIAGLGIHTTDSGNVFAHWNHVFFYYCSSDAWTGVSSETLLSPDNPDLAYSMYVRGHSIVAAAFDALDAGLTSDDGQETLPPITDATQVIWSGTSAGSHGALMNADWVSARFNPDQTQVAAIFDAAITPLLSDALPDNIASAGRALYEAGLRDSLTRQDEPPFMDESCVAATAPEDLWQCLDAANVRMNYVTTPFFARMDLSDSNAIDDYLALGATAQQFSEGVLGTLSELHDIRSTAAEADHITRAPGVYGPNCGQHVALESTRWFLTSTVVGPDGPTTYQDAFIAWASGSDVEILDDVDGTQSTCSSIDGGH